MSNKFSPWPSYTEEEAEAISRVLLSNKVNYWTGEECKLFENEFAEWCGSKHAIALSNGTVALELSLRALDIGKGDEVIVTSRTFIASVSCILSVGAKPVFADVNSESQNISTEVLEELVTSNTKAIICVHLAGLPCEMDTITDIARSRNLYVIEDCAQAHGAKYKGRSVGTFGHVSAWSFCQDKIMTTGGEGGMLTTDDERLRLKLWSFKEHGKSMKAISAGAHTREFSWVHESLGTNGRMTELQAAIGRIQLRRMSEWHKRRTSNALLYKENYSSMPAIRVPVPTPDIEHAWYKLSVFIELEKLHDGWDRNRVLSEICELDVPCQSGPCPEVYLEKTFDNYNCRPVERLKTAKALGESSLVFQVHPTLTDEEIHLISDVTLRVLSRATGHK